MAFSSIKVHINYLLWRFGVRNVLPSYYIQKVEIIEGNEPLAPIVETDKLLLDHRIGTQHSARKSIVERLNQAAAGLPSGFKLLIVEAFRSLERQQQCWEEERMAIATANPHASPLEVDRLTSLIVANPTNNNTGGHQTGAAVDLTLADADGKEVFMGTGVQEFKAETPTNAEVPAEIANRRAILRKAMESAGFVNYPGEWWHFSCGDRLWAAYKLEPSAHFGPLVK